MGLLGDKMLKAGVVTQADADRLHRQEIIEKEKKRKEERRQELQEQRRRDEEWRNTQMDFLASLSANLAVKTIALEYLGFTEEECRSILTGDPPPDLPLLAKLGNASEQIFTLVSSGVMAKAVAEERERLQKDPEFRKTMAKHL